MSSARLLRPLMRTQAFARPIRSAAFSTKVSRIAAPSVASQVPLPSRQQQKKAVVPSEPLKTEARTILMAAMPQLVPFYFTNEVAAAFVIIPSLIYLLTKYWLPQTVRTKLARLFISKL